MTTHAIVVEYSEDGPPQITGAPAVVEPGDEITIEVRDYSPPPECHDHDEYDDAGNVMHSDVVSETSVNPLTGIETVESYYIDDTARITVAPPQVQPSYADLMFIAEMAALGATEYDRLSALAADVIKGKGLPPQVAA